jgi:hypothetical protein
MAVAHQRYLKAAEAGDGEWLDSAVRAAPEKAYDADFLPPSARRFRARQALCREQRSLREAPPCRSQLAARQN